MKHAIPKPKIVSKLYQIVQRKEELSTDFFNRLTETDQKYTAQLAHIFIGQSNADIKWKWQKLQTKESRTLSKLLRVAWSVYTSRQEVERKREK